MECSRCGLPIADGDRVCPACGAPVAVPPTSLWVVKPAASQDRSQDPAAVSGEGAEPVAENAPPASSRDAARAVTPPPTAPATEIARPAPAAAIGGPSNTAGAPNGGYRYPAYAYNTGVYPAPTYGAYPGYPYPANPYPANPYAAGAYAYPGYAPAGATYAGTGAAGAGPHGVPLAPAAPRAPAGQPAYPYPYPYPYEYGFMPIQPRRAPGETYRLVLAWIVIVGSGLSVAVGLLMGLASLVLAGTPGTNGLTTLDVVVALALVGICGGGAALYFGITAVMRRPSVRFVFPPWWIFLILSVLVIGGAVVLWHQQPAPGPAPAVLPLALLAGLLPALTILSFASGALRSPSTRRHVIVSFVHGATLAILLALILETILQIVIVLIMQAFGFDVSGSVGNLTTAPSGGPAIVAMLLLLSVVAPLVEEGVKPLGALLLMPRLRGPAEAFLVGLAAGIGFDFVETVGYIGMGEADWVSVAVQRIGAGLLHGVGAGMGALGWYYLVRGKGSNFRWLLGFGGLAYAVLQHAFFNGTSLAVGLVPGPVGKFLNFPIYLDRLPLDGGTGIFFFYYLVIAGVLVLVTHRLRRLTPAASPSGAGGSAPGQPPGQGMPRMPAAPQPVQGGAR